MAPNLDPSALRNLVDQQTSSIARLEARLAEVEGSRSHSYRRARHLRVAAAVGIALVCLLASMAGASAGDPLVAKASPYYAIPAHKLYNSTSLAAHKTLLPVVAAAATTVP